MTGRIFAELIFSGGVITNIIFLHFLIFVVLHHQRLYLIFLIGHQKWMMICNSSKDIRINVAQCYLMLNTQSSSYNTIFVE